MNLDVCSMMKRDQWERKIKATREREKAINCRMRKREQWVYPKKTVKAQWQIESCHPSVRKKHNEKVSSVQISNELTNKEDCVWERSEERRAENDDDKLMNLYPKTKYKKQNNMNDHVKNILSKINEEILNPRT